MPRAGDVLDLTPIGAVFHIKKTARETHGGSFEMEWELAPRTGGTPVHVHPQATESYEVLEGKLDLYVGGTWRTLSPGEKASVNPGVPHTFRNANDARTRVYNTHVPALRYGEYFDTLHRVIHRAGIQDGRMSLKAILYVSILMTSYEDEIRSVNPPQAVMRVFAAVGRLLGYRVSG